MSMKNVAPAINILTDRDDYYVAYRDIRVADIVARDIHDALDLITNPLRLRATLRD